MTAPTATEAWLNSLVDIAKGNRVSPRGKPTFEVPQRTLTVDMLHPVVVLPERKLNYKFMAAEAYWILTGDDRVETIAPYNPNISAFSDDGVKFFGAYGPKIMGQIDYVVNKLVEDRDSRQAGLTIWRENPPATKDVPCTVAMFFSIRERAVNCHVFMRSSDIWLGVPYDVFNFSMVAYMVCAKIKTALFRAGRPDTLYPGTLFLTAASAHLYETNLEAATAILSQPTPPSWVSSAALAELYTSEHVLMAYLEMLRTSKPGSVYRWWEGNHDSNQS